MIIFLTNTREEDFPEILSQTQIVNPSRIELHHDTDSHIRLAFSTIYRIGNEINFWHYGNLSPERIRNKAVQIYLISKKYDICPYLTTAIGITESNLTHNVKPSRAGAIGIMQLMPATAEYLNVNPYDRNENIEGGVKFLSELIDQYGDVDKALSHYNSGSPSPLTQETINYLWNVNNLWDSMKGGNQN